jgi:hypothetical protein
LEIEMNSTNGARDVIAGHNHADTPTDDLPVITSAMLEEMDCEVEWLVDGLIQAGRNGLLAGPMKCMKSTLSVSLAVHLATGADWLGRAVKPTRVCLWSVESGRGSLRATARRVCKSLDIRHAEIGDRIFWLFEPVDLCSPAEQTRLRRYVEMHGIGLALIDPAYLMLQGVVGSENSQFGMGAALSWMTKFAADTGCGIGLNCHSTKNVNSGQKPYQPMMLEQVAHSGLSAFARWFMLGNRRSKYDPSKPGLHQLWFDCGNSDGGSVAWALDLDEGLHGGTWSIDVQEQSEFRQESRDDREKIKQERKQRHSQEQDNRVLSYMRSGAGRTWLPASKIRAELDFNSEKIADSLTRLQNAGLVKSKPNPIRRDSTLYLVAEAVAEVEAAEKERQRVTDGIKKTAVSIGQDKSSKEETLSSPVEALDVDGFSSATCGQLDEVDSKADLSSRSSRSSRTKPNSKSKKKVVRKATADTNLADATI